jgi:glycosyltransferase involved in cell wall biosynthesis
VLLELRPAFDGHAGIPQEARLLFRGLRMIEGIDVEGLLQHSGHVLAKGLPPRGGGDLAPDRQLNRLSRVVVSTKQELTNAHVATTLMALRQMLGARETLYRFDASHFRDFVWQALFARTLHAADFDSVTRAGFRVARVPWTGMHRCALVTRKLGYTLHPRIDTSDFDVLIAETPYPARVADGTRLVVRYHDAIPLLMPHTISDMSYHQASHYRALRRNVASGAHFACVSEATRKDLLSVFPEVEARSSTIHNMVSHHYFRETADAARIEEILRTRASERIKGLPNGTTTAVARAPSFLARAAQPNDPGYLLAVATIEPRKNHAGLIAAWEHLRTSRFPGLRLVVVGMPGWGYEALVAKFKPWLARGQLFVLEDVPAPELRLLYSHARATVCPSFGEGFDFSGVEAMRCGSPVIASEIAAHREVYRDAAEYCSPYSVADLAEAIGRVIDPAAAGLRQALVTRGAEVSQRYTPEAILPQWREYLLGTVRAEVK